MCVCVLLWLLVTERYFPCLYLSIFFCAEKVLCVLSHVCFDKCQWVHNSRAATARCAAMLPCGRASCSSPSSPEARLHLTFFNTDVAVSVSAPVSNVCTPGQAVYCTTNNNTTVVQILDFSLYFIFYFLARRQLLVSSSFFPSNLLIQETFTLFLRIFYLSKPGSGMGKLYLLVCGRKYRCVKHQKHDTI